MTTRLTAEEGRLRMRHFGPGGKPASEADAQLSFLAFYRDDYVLILDEDAKPIAFRADFIRDPAGLVQWLRVGGRLNRRMR